MQVLKSKQSSCPLAGSQARCDRRHSEGICRLNPSHAIVYHDAVTALRRYDVGVLIGQLGQPANSRGIGAR